MQVQAESRRFRDGLQWLLPGVVWLQTNVVAGLGSEPSTAVSLAVDRETITTMNAFYCLYSSEFRLSMTLSLQGYVQLRQTWRSLDLEQHFVRIAVCETALIEKILAVGYMLLKNGDFSDALALIDGAYLAGLESVWLSDCRARALFYLERFTEARLIWERLLESDNRSLQRDSQKMLSACANRLRLAEAQWIQDQLIQARGDLNALLELWTQYPDSSATESAVHYFLRSRLSIEHSDWFKLEMYQRFDLVALEAEVVWLSAVRSTCVKTVQATTE